MAGSRKHQAPRRTDLGTCSVEGCGKPGFALGLCHSHYTISRKAEREAEQDIIEVDGVRRFPARIGKNGKVNGGNGSGIVGQGRPPLLVNDEETIKRIRDLAALQCTIEESAGVMNVDGETLRRFMERHRVAKEAFEFGRLSGKVSVRRLQFIHAKKNATMAIWLGKQMLNQSEPIRLGPLSGNRQADELGIAPPTALLRAVQGDHGNED